MIISTLIYPNSARANPCVTGHSSMADAVKALSEDWPIKPTSIGRTVTLRDYDGYALLLETSELVGGTHA